MEVTIENFEQVLPLVESSIAAADFISIDTEFSGTSVFILMMILISFFCSLLPFIGVNVGELDQHNAYDNVEERY